MAWIENYNTYIINAYAEKAISKNDADLDDVDLDDIMDVESRRRGSVMQHPAELALHQYMSAAVKRQQHYVRGYHQAGSH